jgi:hypothetical protein
MANLSIFCKSSIQKLKADGLCESSFFSLMYSAPFLLLLYNKYDLYKTFLKAEASWSCNKIARAGGRSWRIAFSLMNTFSVCKVEYKFELLPTDNILAFVSIVFCAQSWAWTGLNSSSLPLPVNVDALYNTSSIICNKQ